MDRGNYGRLNTSSLYVIASTIDFAPSSIVNSFVVYLNLYLSSRERDFTEDDVYVVLLIFRVTLYL
jgi:hypothetical protein